MDNRSDSVSEDLSSPELSNRREELYQTTSKLKFSIQNILRPDFGKVRVLFTETAMKLYAKVSSVLLAPYLISLVPGCMEFANRPIH